MKKILKLLLILSILFVISCGKANVIGTDDETEPDDGDGAAFITETAKK